MLQIDTPDEVQADARIARAQLTSYLRSQIEGLSGEVQLFQFHAGHSNLTYLVRCGARELVLKRAPEGRKASSAHDMGREFRILARLNAHYPYAPKALAYCEDSSIVGSPFCVMERAQGVIVRDQFPAGVSDEQIRLQFEHLIDGLAQLHGVDVAAAGLTDFGKGSGYRERQIGGWSRRLAAAATDDMADFGAITAWLMANRPPEPETAAIVHNDFKLDNLVWEPSEISTLKAVLDWEMSTVGDAAFDLACTLSFWQQADDPPAFRAMRGMPTSGHGVMSRREAARRYTEYLDRPLPALSFLLCFGYFRRAAIEQQKYARFKRGDTRDPRFAKLQDSVATLRQMCLEVMSGSLTG
jgi:aminoglycoside phosphotransferase (APT) family kinase protein